MSDAIIRARLGVDRSEWTGNLSAAEADAKRFGVAVNEQRAVVAALESQMRAAGKTVSAELKQQFQDADLLLRKYEQFRKVAEKQVKTFQVVQETPTAPLAVPSAATARAGAPAVIRVAEEAGVAGLSRTGKMELGHVGRSIGGSVLAGASVGRAVEMEGPRILSVLGEMGLGMSALIPLLGALAPVVAAAATAFTVYNANREAVATRRALSQINENPDTLGDLASDFNNPDLDWRSRGRRWQKRNRLELLQSKLPEGSELPERYTRSAKELQEEEGAATEQITKAKHQEHSKRNRLAEFFGGGLRGKDVQAAENRRNSIRQERAEVEERDQGFARRAFVGDPSVESDKLHVQLQERLSQIAKETADGKMKDGEAQTALAHGAFNLGIDEMRRRQDGAKIAAELEGRIVDIKKSGYHVDLQIVQARLDAANAALKNGPPKGEEHERLQNAVKAAQVEVEAVGATTRERENQFALETRMANLRGSSEQVRKATLDLERGNIQRKLVSTDTQADEIPGLTSDLARNTQQQAEFEKQKNLRSIDTAETEDRAHAGRSYSEKLRVLGDELGFNEQRKAWNRNENGNDPEVAAQLDEKFHDLAQTVSDLIFSEKQHIQSLKDQDTQIRGRGYEPTLGMKDRSVDARYQRQIDEEAHGNNDPKVIAALERNRADEHFENAVDEAMLTPAQKAARARANNKRAETEEQVRARERRHSEVDAANHSNFEQFFGGADRHTIGGHATMPHPESTRKTMPGPSAAQNSPHGSAPIQLSPEAMTILGAIRDNCDFKMR